MRFSCISAYFIIIVRRRAAAIAMQKNGNSRKIIRLSSTPLPLFHTIYLSERLLLNTFTSNIFAHSLHKSKGSPWAKKYMNEKRLKCSSTTLNIVLPMPWMGLIDASTKVSRKSSYGLTYFSWYYCHNTAPKAINI